MIQKDTFYHIYNQGNRNQQVFFEDDDYIKFLRLVRNFVLPNCDILAYCLMPNHYHFLINSTEYGATQVKQGNIYSTKLANSFRMLQSSYAQYINKKHNEYGSLFKQKTQFKSIDNTSYNNFLMNCFIYIHQNPAKALLVIDLKDWRFSSYLDFAGLRNGSLINFDVVNKFLAITKNDFINLIKIDINEKIIKIFMVNYLLKV